MVSMVSYTLVFTAFISVSGVSLAPLYQDSSSQAIFLKQNKDVATAFDEFVEVLYKTFINNQKRNEKGTKSKQKIPMVGRKDENNTKKIYNSVETNKFDLFSDFNEQLPKNIEYERTYTNLEKKVQKDKRLLSLLNEILNPRTTTIGRNARLQN
ncbi:uncharacterized protein LOC136075444 [Hydra vulgaris]|uniref:Uncharacterized protein LOC136075444 n=1 Tax=Hydra vulgaris TaxID=6087 RepID=A0ABM4B7A1_HYDVU